MGRIVKARHALSRSGAIIVLLHLFLFAVAQDAGEHKVSVYASSMTLKSVLKIIEKQTDLRFNYLGQELNVNEKITARYEDKPLNFILSELFSDKGIQWKFIDKNVYLRKGANVDKIQSAESVNDTVSTTVISGRVTDLSGTALPGATIMVKGYHKGTSADNTGRFRINDVPQNGVLNISLIGYEPVSVAIAGASELKIQLKQAIGLLDESVVMAYGTTSRRINTGSISKISANEIGNQPVSNTLQALEGRVPGLVVNQTSGYSGGGIKIQIRGQNSLINGNDPFFIIDGVPFAPNNTNINQLGTVVPSGISPFSLINPSDIESIEILKDADATAIYGSRGANGVILITTKKGKAGKTGFTANVYTAQSRVNTKLNMLSVDDYLSMRKEAFKNDGLIPNSNAGTLGYAPDLTIWNQHQSTDWQKWLMGGTAKVTSANASFSGGNENTQFLLGGNYYHETTVFPTDDSDTKGSGKISVNHKSVDKRFFLNFSVNYSIDDNHIFNTAGTSIGNIIFLPPNLPSLTDSSGKIKWQQNGIAFENPLGNFLRKYEIKTNNLISSLQLGYNITKDLRLLTNIGYNTIQVNEVSVIPIAAQSPITSQGALGSSSFGTNNFKSLIVEPQLNYKLFLPKGKLDFLVGGTFQNSINEGLNLNAGNYTSDNQLYSLTAAPTILNKFSQYSKYKYGAVFLRITYNLDDKYILNISGRRDGSSRFGPDKRFNNFGSVGLAWLFSNEDFIKNNIPVLTYGKLRTSYGVTGNDQIGDYNYLNTWKATNPYNGVTALKPTSLFNADYTWERNKKFEGALELGLLNNRVFTTIAYFQNTSGNQLVQYILPNQTGFISILKNLPAKVQNSGFEIDVHGDIIKRNQFNWAISLNVTVPRNKLVSFPGLATSTYANFYVEGKSITTRQGIKSLGVDPQSGLYKFEDKDKNGIFDNKDYYIIGNLDPKFYGGISNTFSYKRISLDFLFDFKRQMSGNYLNSIYRSGNYPPGTQNNQATLMLGSWHKAGDQAAYQQFSSLPSFRAKNTANINQSDLLYGNTTYIRLKNVAIRYSLPNKWISKARLTTCSIYALAQNLFTITNYKVGDPEVQNASTLPVLRTFAVGLNIGL